MITKPNFTFAHSTILPDTEFIAFIERQYDIGKITQVKYWIRATNDHYLIETKSDKYILRIHTHLSYWLSNTIGVQFEIDLLQYLIRQGFDTAVTVPRINGRHFGSIMAPEGKRWFTLFKYLEGEVPDKLDKENAKLLGNTLATFHNQTSNFEGDYKIPRRDFQELVIDKIGWLKNYWKHENKGKIDFIDTLSQKLHKKIMLLPKDKGRFGIISADFHQWNCLMSDDGVSLLDLDYAGMGWRIYDIAVFKWGLERSRLGNKIWDAFLEGYQAIRGLTAKELEVIPYFKLIRVIWRSAASIAFVNRFGHSPYKQFFNRDFKKIQELNELLF